MRVECFVPGHISCIFRPVRGPDTIRTGSLGLGLRLNLGCHASVEARDDPEVIIRINGEECEAPITRMAIGTMGVNGLDIDLKHDLPLQQGFGASASGTYAATLCVASLFNIDRMVAMTATHTAECTLGGGLGDLLAIESRAGVPVRAVAGAPMVGSVVDPGLSLDDFSVAIMGGLLSTASVLGDDDKVIRITEAGDKAMSMFLSKPSIDNLFECASMFSKQVGLESLEVSEAIAKVEGEGHKACMCMLGNSIYSDLPADELKRILPNAEVFSCSTYSEPIRVTRTE